MEVVSKTILLFYNGDEFLCLDKDRQKRIGIEIIRKKFKQIFCFKKKFKISNNVVLFNCSDVKINSFCEKHNIKRVVVCGNREEIIHDIKIIKDKFLNLRVIIFEDACWSSREVLKE